MVEVRIPAPTLCKPGPTQTTKLTPCAMHVGGSEKDGASLTWPP